jgi:hypothetical protein
MQDTSNTPPMRVALVTGGLPLGGSTTFCAISVAKPMMA